jgi:hypothetical protein
MMAYKITWQIKRLKLDDIKVVDTFFKWEGSAKDAGSTRKKARQADNYVPNSLKTEKINIPTNKVDLLKFLNTDIVRK